MHAMSADMQSWKTRSFRIGLLALLLASCVSVPLETRVEQRPGVVAEPAHRTTITPSTTSSTGNGAPKAAAPGTKAVANIPASPASSSQLAKKDGPAPELAKQKIPPPLDLNSLEKRLNETHAIDLLDKIAFRNQVNDLLSQFRALYQGKLKTTLSELRRPYDLLIAELLSLLQEKDPSLSATVVASREAIWNILADPAKFAAI
jgi:hypothetical protein